MQSRKKKDQAQPERVPEAQRGDTGSGEQALPREDLNYAQAISLFVQDVDLCERCHLYLAYLELQESLLDIEPTLVEAAYQGCAEVEEAFRVGVSSALKRVGVFCRPCEGRIARTAHRELLPLVLQRFCMEEGTPR